MAMKPLEAKRLAYRAFLEIRDWKAERSRCRSFDHEPYGRSQLSRADRIELRIERLERVENRANRIWRAWSND